MMDLNHRLQESNSCALPLGEWAIHFNGVKHVTGVEPVSSDWKSDILAIVLHVQVWVAGLKPATYGLEVRCSIHLNYTHLLLYYLRKYKVSPV